MHNDERREQTEAWLQQHADACRLACDFLLLDEARPDSDAAETAARKVPIWYKGAYVVASAVLESISRAIPDCQIFEQSECNRYQAVLEVCRTLSKVDARVLFVASGYAGQDGAALHAAAREAVWDSMQNFYHPSAEPEGQEVDDGS